MCSGKDQDGRGVRPDAQLLPQKHQKKKKKKKKTTCRMIHDLHRTSTECWQKTLNL